jgi:hypothetical protein
MESIAMFQTSGNKRPIKRFVGKRGYYRSLVPEFDLLTGRWRS